MALPSAFSSTFLFVNIFLILKVNGEMNFKNKGLKKHAKVLMYPYAHGFSSHMMDFQRITKLLMEQNYDVSVLINNQDKVFMEDISGFKPQIFEYEATSDPSYVRLTDDAFREMMLTQTNQTTVEVIRLLANQQLILCRELLKSSVLLETIRREHFDLLIVDFADACARVIVQYFDYPTVVYSGAGHSFDPAFFPNLPTFIPTFATTFTDEMSFWQRLENMLRLLAIRLISDKHYFDDFDELKLPYIERKGVPSVRKAFGQQLITAHASWCLDFPRPLLPNVVLVGGMHNEPGISLRPDIEDFIAGAGKAGIILVSFGSLIGKLDPVISDNIAKALGQLKQRVIWRHTGSKPPSFNPENTLIMDWVPQNDILAHNQTKLFITHCGIHGTYEAVYHAVPVVATPIWADQFENANRLVRRAKMAAFVDIKGLKSETLLKAINKVLGDQQYRDNAIKASKLLNDRPISAKDTFLSSIDYAIRHEGVANIASRAVLNLDTYQLYGVDIVVFLTAVLIFILIFVLVLIYCSLKLCWRCIFPSGGQKPKSE